ncbi:MAG: TlpA disulfide reductase family protein [Fimbriimonadaceae bacterium]
MIAISILLATFRQDIPQDIAKKDLPKAATCVVCSAGGESHGMEKPAAGVMYKGKAYYLCNSKEIAGFKKDPDSFMPPVLPRPMTDLNISDTSGKLWNAEAMKGKVVLIDFWATWCGPCKEMFPALDKIVARYKDETFVLLSVSVDQKKADLDKYLKSHAFPNPVLHDTTGVFSKWGVRNIPATFLIKNGEVIAQWVGKQTEKTLDTAILKALKG